MDVARDPALQAGGAVPLERTDGAVAALGDVLDRGAVMDSAGGLQLFAARTDIKIALVVIGEIGAGVLAVRRHFSLVPDGAAGRCSLCPTRRSAPGGGWGEASRARPPRRASRRSQRGRGRRGSRGQGRTD